MQNTIEVGAARLVCADSLQFIKTLPDNSVDLIVTDPPYFGVKSDAWDNQWSSDADFLGWIDEFLAEFWRILKPAGSLYLFTGSRLAADVEILMRNRMNVLNHIIWAKPSGPWRRQNKESLRRFFPSTERILFAEHYGSSGYAKGASGYATACADLHKDVFAPLISYFSNARKELGISAADINAATGKQMCSHWFSSSQWRLPGPDDYEKLYALFSRVAREKNVPCPLDRGYKSCTDENASLVSDYTQLKQQYSELQAQYLSLRRPFSVSSDVPYTDVWSFAPVPYYPGKHPCEKPASLLQHIISASSKPGDLVADFFMGSGSTLKAALTLGREALGVELDEARFSTTVNEIKGLSGL